jgi:hypothetical protein
MTAFVEYVFMPFLIIATIALMTLMVAGLTLILLTPLVFVAG